MNLNPVYELEERLYAAAIAGVNLIGEDFRLKRAVEQMEPLSSAVPVFKKIYEVVQRMIQPECENPSSMLLDALALIQAVLCTQGSVRVEGELSDLEEGTGKIICNISYSILAPVRQALENTGGGRYSTLMEAHQNHPELFCDYRVKRAMIEDLSDSYAEISDLLKKWLIEQGDKSILPVLKKGFHSDGKREMALRVEIMAGIAGSEENDFYIESLENASNEVKKALIEALGMDKQNAKLLLELVKKEKGTIKDQIIWELSDMDEEETRTYMAASMKKDPVKTFYYLEDSKKDWISDLVAADMREHMEEIFLRLKEFKQLSKVEYALRESELSKDIEYLQASLRAMMGKSSDAMQDLYRYLASRIVSLELLEQEEKNRKSDLKFCVLQVVEGEEKQGLCKSISKLLAELVILTENKEKIAGLVEELYSTYGTLFIEAKFALDLLQKEKEEVYEQYHLFLEKALLEKTKKQSKSDWKVQQDAARQIVDVFGRIIYSEERGCYQFVHVLFRNRWQETYDLNEGLSIRWFEPLIKYIRKNKRNITIVSIRGNHAWLYGSGKTLLYNLFIPSDEEVKRSIGKGFYEWILEEGGSYKDIQILLEFGWSDFKGVLYAGVSKMQDKSKIWTEWQVYYAIKTIPFTQEECMEELRSIIDGPWKNRASVKYVNRWLEALKMGMRVEEIPFDGI